MSYHHLARRRMPSGLFLRSLSNFASYPAASASFFRCTLSKSALKAATSSSERGIIPWLAVPAPWRCLSYILLCYSVPDGHRKSLYVPPDSQNVYVAPMARFLHSSDANTPLPTPGPIYRVRMRQLHQRKKEKRRLTQDLLY